MAYILEETKGNLPLWLAPTQVKILPIKNDDDELNAYAEKVADVLEESGLRVELDDRSEKFGYKMREAQVEKVPYIVVLGNNEAAENKISFRLHGAQKTETVDFEAFTPMLLEEIKNKSL